MITWRSLGLDVPAQPRTYKIVLRSDLQERCSKYSVSFLGEWVSNCISSAALVILNRPHRRDRKNGN